MLKKYIEAGTYFWNAGMFILKSSMWLKVQKDFRQSLQRLALKLGKKGDDDNFVRPNIEQLNPFLAIQLITR